MNGDRFGRVVDIMTTPAITIGRGATLRYAATVFRDARVGALVVLAEDGQFAVVSERDIVRALADDADPDEVRIGDVVTEEPRYVTPGHPAVRVAEEMLAAGVRHLPVVEDSEVVGMVSARDALRSVTMTLLGHVSAPDVQIGATDLERELAHLGG